MSPKYNKLLNSLTIFGSILLIIWLMLRFGILLEDNYYPAYILSHYRALTDPGKIIISEIKARNYVLLFAILPEIIFVMELVLIVVVNWVYYACVDKAQRLLNNETGLDASLKDIV
jgi:hypothetical protein